MATTEIEVHNISAVVPSAAPSDGAGQPRQQLELADETQTSYQAQYPTGTKLWFTVTSLFIVAMLYGLNLTVVAATIPSVTNQFKTVENLGWYSSAYSVMMASFGLIFGKLYGLVSVKRLYLTALAIFELGCLLCTVAPTSWFFILGRAVAGIGAAGLQSGSWLILSQCFPKRSRPMWVSILSASQMLGIISAPIVGGALIDWISWRGCFGINIPLGLAAAVLMALRFENIVINQDAAIAWREKVKRFDLLGAFFMVPSITCLLLALQWGGIRFGWADARIIVLFILFAALLAIFVWRQCCLQEGAILPPRIMKMRTVLAGTWYSACIDSVLAVTEFYVTVYFQGVKEYTATQSGLLLLPMLIGLCIGSLCGGAGTTRLGYYNPFMIATTVLAPIASGLLTTSGLDDQPFKILCLLGFLGLAVGLSLNAPIMALQVSLKASDLPLGLASLAFGATMGNAIWIVVSAALFENRLVAEITNHSPSTNVSLLEDAGLSEIRGMIGSDRLRDVLLGYDAAVTQTLYLPVGLCVATIIGSAFVEWHSVRERSA